MVFTRIGIFTLALAGCAARVPVQVPAAPSVQMPSTAIAVVAVDRDCREVADALTSELQSLDGMRVQPDAPTQIKVWGCHSGWVATDAGHLEGRSVAIAALSTPDGVAALLLGAARGVERASEEERAPGRTTVNLNKRVQSALVGEVGRDLAEQVAPVSTVVRRRVYENAGSNSARHFHNLAVAAERDGRIGDALWWARLAWERRPTPRGARYVAELTRRLARTEPNTVSLAPI